MRDPIKHECGIAHLRLRKSLQYYIDKYGTTPYGANKLRLEVKKKSGPSFSLVRALFLIIAILVLVVLLLFFKADLLMNMLNQFNFTP